MEPADAPALSDVVARGRTHRKTVRVCNFTGDPDDLAAIEAHLEPHDVDFEVVDDAPDRPDDVVDIVSWERWEATSPVAEVLAYVRAWEASMAGGLAREPPAALARLDDTFFESYDKRRMVMASRIAEFRARNVGAGVLTRDSRSSRSCPTSGAPTGTSCGAASRSTSTGRPRRR